METLKVGDTTIHWLNGGVTHMDGGAMFGVVPKPLWSKKYAVNDLNQIELRTDPLFFQWEGKNVLIESGIGKGKLNEKQKRNYGVHEESDIEASLSSLGLTPRDIDVILMTHMHFDHACGLTEYKDGELVSVFPNATIHTSQVEWEEMKNPNVRSQNTYWKENWESIESQVVTFKEEKEVLPGITMVHTGGHSDGHSIILLESDGEKFIHMADIMPTHAHKNPLWVLAYDDYPMTSIGAKEKWIGQAIDKEYWFLFYHDAVYRGIKWNRDGEIVDKVMREK
ncbi:MBL fold metallo-hydrolase [Bacillus sp. BHET2]|uniref:YtnP family quorum-quenching lactonase n=1 Tax=Bacillus sp. BHET2 TaxID=2583818 RepID=UPI00110F4ACF|nr:MBL fold metallo-hydrolase [Bacillus sp. BHET2]TMU85962.1 MBL fold metallo-hydrolase [Bacillus sp. BHET2]